MLVWATFGVHQEPKQARYERTGTVVARGNLGEVTVVVALHFEIEDLRLRVARFRDEVLVEKRLKKR